MGIDAWGWDAPLWMQAEEAKRRGEPGIFWAAHQADRAYTPDRASGQSRRAAVDRLHRAPASRSSSRAAAARRRASWRGQDELACRGIRD